MKRESRAILIGGGVVTVALFARIGLGAVADLDRRLTLLSDASVTVARAEALVAERHAADSTYRAAVERAATMQDALLDAESAGGAARALRDVLVSWADLHHMTIVFSGPDETVPDGLLARVMVAAHLRGAEVGLVGWLARVESDVRVLSIPQLTIRQEGDGLEAVVSIAGWALHAP